MLQLLPVLLFPTGDLSDLGKLYSISLDDFEKDILPDLQDHDSVIWFHSEGGRDVAHLHKTVEK